MKTGIRIISAMAFTMVLAHTLTNGQYGFFRDQLGTLGDARHLAWGYPSPIRP